MVLILCSVVMDSPLLNSIHFREKKSEKKPASLVCFSLILFLFRTGYGNTPVSEPRLPLGHPVRQLCDLDDDHRHKRQTDRDHQMAWIQRRH